MDEKETVRVAASGFELVKIDELVPYARNAKKHSKEQIKKIRASLREFGFVSPVLIDRQKNVLAGHGRIEAAKAEGMNEVPCVFADGLTEAQRRAYIIADNRLTELGEWDMEELTFEMEALDGVGFPVDVTGFSMEEIIGVEEEGIAEDDEFVPENAKELRVRAGEVWALGRHRLMCGSSASGEDIVLDGFGGSGSTLIACEQLGRVCRIMEIDPKYAQVIIDRGETLTGETAVRIA